MFFNEPSTETNAKLFPGFIIGNKLFLFLNDKEMWNLFFFENWKTVEELQILIHIKERMLNLINKPEKKKMVKRKNSWIDLDDRWFWRMAVRRRSLITLDSWRIPVTRKISNIKFLIPQSGPDQKQNMLWYQLIGPLPRDIKCWSRNMDLIPIKVPLQIKENLPKDKLRTHTFLWVV